MLCQRWSFVVVGLVLLSAGAVRAQAPSADSPDKKITARGDGKTIVLTDAASQKELRRFLGHTGNVTAVAFSPDGKVLATGGDDKVVNIWDVATGKQIISIRTAGAVIKSVSYSQDGRTLTVEDADKAITIYDAATGKRLK
jgi:WD40 repeat protein